MGRGARVVRVGGFLAVGADQSILVGLDGESPQGDQLGWLGEKKGGVLFAFGCLFAFGYLFYTLIVFQFHSPLLA